MNVFILCVHNLRNFLYWAILYTNSNLLNYSLERKNAGGGLILLFCRSRYTVLSTCLFQNQVRQQRYKKVDKHFWLKKIGCLSEAGVVVIVFRRNKINKKTKHTQKQRTVVGAPPLATQPFFSSCKSHRCCLVTTPIPTPEIEIYLWTTSSAGTIILTHNSR